MAHNHIHKATVGGIVITTGPALADSSDSALHFHMFGNNERTSSDPLIEGQVHTIRGRETSIPIIQSEGFPSGIPPQ